jgi:hypothetical protein
MTDLYVEDIPSEEPLYTEDDAVVSSPVPSSKYKVLAGIINTAAGETKVDPEKPIDYKTTVDQAWQEHAPELHAMDETIAKKAAAKGEVAMVAQALSEMKVRADMYSKAASSTYEEVYSKTRDLARKSFDVVSADINVINNNSVEDITNKREKVSSELASMANMERTVEDSMKLSPVNYGVSLLHEVSPVGPLQGYAIQKLLLANPKYGITEEDVSLMTTRNQLYTMLQNTFKTLPPEEKLPWLDMLLKDLNSTIATNKLHISSIISNVLSGEDLEIGGVGDWLDRAGVALLPVQALGVGLRVGAKLTSASRLTTASRTLAESGGKALVEAGTTAETLASMARKEQVAAAGIVAAEVTGVSAVMDLTKLVSLGASKMLPDAVTAAVTGSSEAVRAKALELRQALQNTVSINGNADVAAELEAIKHVYSTANNPTVHNAVLGVSEDGLSVGGTVYYKPANASAYVTKEAAQVAVDTIYAGRNVSIVPDTTNTGFLVEESVVKTLQMQRDAKLALLAEELLVPTTKSWETRIDELIADRGYKISVGERSAVSGGDGKYNITIADMDEAAFMVKHGNSKADVKAHEFAHAFWRGATGLPNPKSPSSKELFKELRTVSKEYRPYVWEHHAKHADTVEELMADGLAFWLKYPERRAEFPTLSKTIDEYGFKESFAPAASDKWWDNPSLLNDDIARDLFANKTSKLASTGGVLHSSTVQSSYISSFVNNLGKRLGMENHKLIVVQASDLVEMGKTDKLFANLHTSFINNGAAEALHMPTRYGSVIVMRDSLSATKVNEATKIQKHMELFAHEYAHAFAFAFQVQHGEQFKGLFRTWLREKKLPFTETGTGNKYKLDITKALPMEALFEYRNITQGDKYLLNQWVSNYFKGDKAAYLKHEKELHNWLNSYEEFFAENFAKWAFTDEVPTSILGKTFAGLVNGIKEIASNIQAMFGGKVLIGANKKVSEFLNAHIKAIDAGKYEARTLTSALAKMSQDIKPSAADLQDEISFIEEQLAAYEAAKSGLKHGWLIKEDVKQTVTFDKTSVYTDRDINSTVKLSLGDWNLGTSSEQYNQRVVGVHAGSRYTKLLTDFVRKPIERLSREERVMLDSVLVKGDQEGKVFTDMELAGEGLNQRTREAYHTVRELRDVMWAMRDNTLTRIYTKKNFKNLNINPTIVPLTAPRTIGRVISSTEQINARFIYDLSDAKQVMVTDELVRDSLVFELATPMSVGTKKYSHIAVKSSDVRMEELTSVLPYRTGEYSRNYSDEYFVKIKGLHNIDGVDVEQLMTHRTASNAKQGKAYVNAFNEAVDLFKAEQLTVTKATELMQPFGWKGEDFLASLHNGEFGANPKAQVLYNRTDDDYLNSFTGLGGLLGKQRGERIASVSGAENTLNPLDSIASEISNTAFVASSAEWREAHVYKWFKTFYADFPKHVQAMTPERAFTEMLSHKEYYGDIKRLQVAKRVQDYLVDQMNIMTEEEKMWVGKARQLSEAFEARVDTPAMHTIGAFMRQSSDWPKYARTIAFHTFQGMFNLKHLFMQGMNAFNAVVISPLHGLPASKTSSLYAMALMSDNESIWRNVAKANKLTNLGLGMSEDEFVLAVQTIRRSGLIDGIGHNSMWGAEGGKFGLFNGATRVAGQISAAPFNAGEGYSRLVSFDIARREWITNNPNKAWWTDDAVAEMLARQDDLTQNMTRANTTSWQKGWKAIPTQYTQYQVKLLLNAVHSLGGNERVFTRNEAVRLILGHTMLLGTAGWGMLPDEWTNEWFKDQDEGTKLTILQGFFAGAIYHLTEGEAKLAIGSTFGSFNYYKDVFDGLTDPKKTLVAALAGPSGFAITRLLGKTGDAINMFRYGGVTMDSTKAAMKELAGGFSSLNNAQKAYIASSNFNALKTDSGVDKYRMSDLEVYAYGMGIPPVQEADLKTLFKSKQEYEQTIKDVGKEIGHYRMLAYTALRNGDKESYTYYINAIQMAMAPFTKDAYAFGQLYKYSVEVPQWSQTQRLIIEDMRKDMEGADFIVNNNPYKD